jgi:hypothetical protein
MPEQQIQSGAWLTVGELREPAPDDLVSAMIRFERRYGGLTYPLISGNSMDYGLDGDTTGHRTEHGIAFTGILDGDWTWGVDVLIDGRTGMSPGSWPFRIIDRSVDQRLEKHALLAAVREWPHRTYECQTPPGVRPIIDDDTLSCVVPEASGPTDLWWNDDTTAVEVSLRSWPPEHDCWTVRYFTRIPGLLAEADQIIRTRVRGKSTPANWCSLCACWLTADQACNA